MLRFVMIALAALLLHVAPLTAAAGAHDAGAGAMPPAPAPCATAAATAPDLSPDLATDLAAGTQSGPGQPADCTSAFAFLPAQDVALPTRAFRRLSLMPPDAIGSGLAPGRQMRPPRG